MIIAAVVVFFRLSFSKINISMLVNLYYNLKYFIVGLGSHHPFEIIWILFINGGWIIFVIVILYGLWWAYLNHIQDKWHATIRWTLLAIDVPKENLQSAKAVEHIFASMWPFIESKNLIEKYIYGMFQLAFSLEIVSIGGYTQFLIRVPVTHKDIVEAAVYAQYPKAEITEVEDYAEKYKDLKFPSEEYDLWGSEFLLTKPSPYPIRTYAAFEHTLTQQFADPMAQIVEVFNKINKDEELWMQIVITPVKDEWKKEGYKIINKIIGAKEEGKGVFIENLFLHPFYYIGTLIEELLIYGIGYEPGQADPASKNKLNEPPNKMLYLTPEEKNIIEGITMKMSKIGYRAKVRAVYLGKKGTLNKPRAVATYIGALQQFSAIDMNSFVPQMKTSTKADYFFVKKRIEWKQNNILRNFRNRGQTSGWGNGFILNIEELASIYHFPIPEALRESLKTVAAKKEAPPSDLPDTIFVSEQKAIMADELAASKKESVTAEPPLDLPM
ncbi:hypothetical protein COV56_01355 [Candidatus Kuenenbacteria bacterium CG11_big_fil_rev_8_21_14_0_20_37_9]|uniref:DUF8128 domain-containing protein n=2 Tax=Candidatus Kueneniibacteriota TaxID=1752740 RepID=A0A2M6XSD6_9BACT|nr:MAG: hypothetical protein AUJ29_01780 [Candidatus Kuenenbacteria bacterium CG1_02_38_13]PIR05676.1 MAG: hypothetical protein COV56_01355 [Candidatus Kuenenbacteria bacterium CG11_big_fil_rev_8_21_14_0_20_37_9]PIU10479.1 MAG: hypothetical protein COT27_02725 [Candidatus Kuenenbacteria bacterium CG08_land_8_20_14_0_20_37_23]